MAGEQIKSTLITNLDATPPIRATAGMGGTYQPVTIDATCHITTGMDNTSTYKLVRIPSRAMVKKVELWLQAAGTTITGSLGVAYSDQPLDEVGQSIGNSGIITAAVWASALALAAVVVPTEYTFNFPAGFVFADTNKELWNTTGVALTKDPGGFFDIVWSSTSTSGSAADIVLRLTYALPYA